MRDEHTQDRWALKISGLCFFLLFPQPSNAKLIPARDPRAGILDASLVVLVKQQAVDQFQIEEVFLGDSKPLDSIVLPGFRLFTYQPDGPDLVDPITPDTRILLFLQHKREDPNAWEVTAYGYCFFWTHNPDKIDHLRKMAKETVELRKAWEAARDISDERSRVQALWPYLWSYSGYLRLRTEAELQKTGAVAGDYIAGIFQELSPNERMGLVRHLGLYGGSYAHEVLRAHLAKMQQTYESYLTEHGRPAESPLENWSTAPDGLKEIYGELFYGLEGLATFKDRSDLPYMRELALWAVKYRFKQTCDAALNAFQSMPDKANLPVIDSIWSEFSTRQYAGNELSAWEVLRALHSHTYPEAVPLLVRFLDDQHAGQEAREALTQIVGNDLGKGRKMWMDWYHHQADPKH